MMRRYYGSLSFEDVFREHERASPMDYLKRQMAALSWLGGLGDSLKFYKMLVRLKSGDRERMRPISL
jgi:hypothetical protein